MTYELPSESNAIDGIGDDRQSASCATTSSNFGGFAVRPG